MKDEISKSRKKKKMTNYHGNYRINVLTWHIPPDTSTIFLLVIEPQTRENGEHRVSDPE